MAWEFPASKASKPPALPTTPSVSSDSSDTCSFITVARLIVAMRLLLDTCFTRTSWRRFPSTCMDVYRFSQDLSSTTPSSTSHSTFSTPSYLSSGSRPGTTSIKRNCWHIGLDSTKSASRTPNSMGGPSQDGFSTLSGKQP